MHLCFDTATGCVSWHSLRAKWLDASPWMSLYSTPCTICCGQDNKNIKTVLEIYSEGYVRLQSALKLTCKLVTAPLLV